jgi:hypothetical protein
MSSQDVQTARAGPQFPQGTEQIALMIALIRTSVVLIQLEFRTSCLLDTACAERTWHIIGTKAHELLIFWQSHSANQLAHDPAAARIHFLKFEHLHYEDT